MTATPDELWHYTTASALLSIVGPDNKKDLVTLRASNLAHLNDAREARWLHVLLADVLRELNLDDYPNETQREAIRGMKDERSETRNYAQGWTDDAGVFTQGVYAACFSTKRDDLGQWRGYGGQNGETGFAIKFDPAVLRDQSGGELVSVKYPTRDEADRFIRSRIAVLRPQPAQEYALGAPMSFPGTWLRNDYIGMERLAASIKHPSFSMEDEHRIIFMWPSSPKWRSSRFGLSPYWEFSLPKTAITELMVGPTPHPGAALASAQQWGKDFLGKDVPVTPSESPFRNW